MKLLSKAIFLSVFIMIMISSFDVSNIITSLVFGICGAVMIDILYKDIPVHTKPFKASFFRMTRYILWLFKEIFISSLGVMKIILSPMKQVDVSAKFRSIITEQDHDVKKIILANSISLTPGTITVGVAGNKVDTNSLTSSHFEELKRSKMDKMIKKI